MTKILNTYLGALRLKIAVSAHTRPSPEDCVNTIRAYFRYISASDSDRLHQLFQSPRTFRDIISSSVFFDVPPKARTSRLLSSVDSLLRANSLLDTLDSLAKNFNGLRGMVGSLEDVIAERVPLGEIYEIAANFGGNIADFVNTMEDALARAKASNAGHATENGVALLTYFRAKGLQWQTVILTTCNEGIIPHRRAPLDEERRLFYVAMTRASSNLLISYVKNSCNNSVSPSRVLFVAGLLEA